jgi:hypothetical protein
VPRIISRNPPTARVPWSTRTCLISYLKVSTHDMQSSVNRRRKSSGCWPPTTSRRRRLAEPTFEFNVQQALRPVPPLGRQLVGALPQTLGDNPYYYGPPSNNIFLMASQVLSLYHRQLRYFTQPLSNMHSMVSQSFISLGEFLQELERCQRALSHLTPF